MLPSYAAAEPPPPGDYAQFKCMCEQVLWINSLRRNNSLIRTYNITKSDKGARVVSMDYDDLC